MYSYIKTVSIPVKQKTYFRPVQGKWFRIEDFLRFFGYTKVMGVEGIRAYAGLIGLKLKVTTKVWLREELTFFLKKSFSISLS